MWNDISEEAKDFIRQTIVAEPKQRMSVAEALKHPWIAVRCDMPTILFLCW